MTLLTGKDVLTDSHLSRFRFGKQEDRKSCFRRHTPYQNGTIKNSWGNENENSYTVFN
jgi:hypothetical protein